MNFISKFRLLPLLVLVSFLSLSVRTLDFISGASNYFSQAQALETVDEEPPQMDEEEVYDLYAQADDVDADEEDLRNPPAPAGPEDPTYDWRDSSEINTDYSNVNVKLFNDLQDRSERLEKKEKELMRKEALLKASEQEIDRKFEELTKIKQELKDLLNSQSKEEEARIKSLVKVYENMKPKDAARIFDTLDIPILVDVASRMSERKLSPVMAQMNPERAKTVTILLAEEKSLPELP